MDYEKKYKEALSKAKSFELPEYKNIMASIFPELAESEDEKVRKELITYCRNTRCVTEEGAERIIKWIAWLEKQGNIDLEFFENSEKEKREFVGYGFLKCKGDFLSFKEGENYWLEYVGKDNYNVRSDNLLGQTFHITPQQLYTVFRPTTWLEKQNEQKPTSDTRYEVGAGGSLSVNGKPFDYEKATITQKDFASKQEPKFKVGDVVCKKKDNSFCVTINSVTDTVYLCDVFDSDGDYDDDYAFLISEQDEYELVAKRVELTQSVTKKSDKVWSEEDEKMYKIALSCIETLEDISNGKNMHADVKEWLKDRIGG